MKLKYQLTSKKRRATNDQFLLGVAAWRKTIAPIHGDHVNNLPLIRDSDIFSFLKEFIGFLTRNELMTSLHFRPKHFPLKTVPHIAATFFL